MKGTILITGGLGYLGGRITSHLASQGYRLRVTSRPDSKLDSRWLPANCELVRVDLLRQPNELVELCKGADAFVHLAAMNEIDSARVPVQAIEMNGIAALQAVEAATKAKVKKFLYMSTAHVYGAPLQGTISETTLPEPLHMYAISHRLAEDVVVAAHRRGDVCGTVLRLSNGFGAPVQPKVDRWTLLVNDLCRQAVVDRKLVLKSSGLQKRDFIAMEDVCRAVEHFLPLERAPSGDVIFNLGGEKPMTIFEMTTLVAECVKDTLGFLPEIVRPQPKLGEVSPPLDYKMDRVKQTGFRLRGDFRKEIAATLKLCQAAQDTHSW